MSNIIFFYRETEENGIYSNWYSCSFTVEGIRYSSVEQYMMAKKALLFGDVIAWHEIMSDNDPHDCKALGRKIRPFVEELWNPCKKEIVYNGVYAKFSQNPQLKQALLATGESEFAEANPQDKIWGIALPADDPAAADKDRWQGQNLLGKILTEVRQALREN